MQGKLTETDARRRHTILNYCEHFRTAYTTKDLDFLKQVFSDKALIIVGNVVKPVANDNKCQAEAKVTYAIHSKKDYISRLAKVFTGQPEDRLEILGIPHHAPSYDGRHYRRHPPAAIQERPLRRRRLSLSAPGISATRPCHSSTCAPGNRQETVHSGDDVISIQDFNLE